MTYFPEDETRLREILHEEFAKNRELSNEEIRELLDQVDTDIEFGDFDPQQSSQIS